MIPYFYFQNFKVGSLVRFDFFSIFKLKNLKCISVLGIKSMRVKEGRTRVASKVVWFRCFSFTYVLRGKSI